MASFRLLSLYCGFALLPFSMALAEEPESPPPPVSAIDPANEIAPEIAPPTGHRPWYRDSGEYLASRSARKTFPTGVNSKIITDAKRFDVSLGQRIPVFGGNEQDLSDGWAMGVDGAMLASLVRYTNEGRLTFATNTFDGTFGLWGGFTNGDGWLAIFRAAHLSDGRFRG
jgi:hypothetical protein